MQVSLKNSKALVLTLRPMPLTSVRTVTDIPWYKVTDNSHLHIIDGQSTKRKFELKLEKLERNRLALERRKHMTKAIPKPSELPPLNLPRFIERGPSDILR